MGRERPDRDRDRTHKSGGPLTIQKLLKAAHPNVLDTKWRWVTVSRAEYHELFADPVFQRMNTNVPEGEELQLAMQSKMQEDRVEYMGHIALLMIFMKP